MDLTSKEARKLLKDYFTWYHDDLHERWWQENAARFGYNPKLTSYQEAINRTFGYKDTKPYHKKLDHTLEIRRGIEKGILLPPADRAHDEIIDELMEIVKDIDLNDLVNGFLYSLSTGKNEYRTALASYFFAKGVEKHKPKITHLAIGYDLCHYCGMSVDKDGMCHIEDSLSRYTLYYPQFGTIQRIQRADYILFDLKQFKALPKVTYTKDDVDILAYILKSADDMGENNKFTALQKQLTRSKKLNMNGNEINVVLGVLSVCGVLQAPDHRGFNKAFKACGDWGFEGYETELFYPLFYWRGRYGVDTASLAEVFPSSVTEAFKAGSEEVSLTEVYEKTKEQPKPSKSQGEEYFQDGRHVLQFDDRIRHYYGLSKLDPSWHKEVRYSRLYNDFTRTEVYFEGNSIRKVICETGSLSNPDGSFRIFEYTEFDSVAETEDRYLLLPKTSKGRKRPWTPSLLQTFTYMGVYLKVNLGGRDFFAFNYRNNRTLSLPGNACARSPLEFYTYTDNYIRNVPEDYENVLNDYVYGKKQKLT